MAPPLRYPPPKPGDPVTRIFGIVLSCIAGWLLWVGLKVFGTWLRHWFSSGPISWSDFFPRLVVLVMGCSLLIVAIGLLRIGFAGRRKREKRRGMSVGTVWTLYGFGSFFTATGVFVLFCAWPHAHAWFIGLFSAAFGIYVLREANRQYRQLRPWHPFAKSGRAWGAWLPTRASTQAANEENKSPQPSQPATGRRKKQARTDGGESQTRRNQRS